MVLSQPEETGEIGYKPVVDTFKFQDKAVIRVDVLIDNERLESFVVTGNHPFWVEDIGWTRADILRPEQKLVIANGKQGIVKEVVWLNQQLPVFNFEVADNHTYYIGRDGI